MKRTGPDSLESWIIACVCCFLNIVIFGLLRLSGLLFVASMSRFQVTRDKAAFPYTLAYIMRNSFGPLVGCLSQKFGVRIVTTIGCILAAIGAGACFFADNIDTVTVLYGVVFGFGAGLGNLLLPVPINQYFDRHRATASGISYAGASLGCFLLAPITEILINNYGLSGTFLFLSGFALNCVPAALLLKKPNFDIKKIVRNLQDHGIIVNGTKIEDFTVEDVSKNPLIDIKDMKNMNNATIPYEENIQNTKLECGERIKQLSAQTILSDHLSCTSNSKLLFLKQNFENCKKSRQVDLEMLDLEIHCLSSQKPETDLDYKKDVFSEEKCISSSVQCENQNYSYQNSKDDLTHRNITDSFSGKAENDDARKECFQTASNNDIYLISYRSNIHIDNHKSQETSKDVPKYSNISKTEWLERKYFKVKHNKFTLPPVTSISKPGKTSPLGTFTVFFDPMFILIIITYAVYCFNFVAVTTVIVDFSRDLQIGVSNEKYVLMTLSAGGLVGRLSLGWITDGGFMRTTNFTAFCFAFQGVLTAAVVWSNGFITLMILTTLYGVSEAGIIVVIPVVIAEYIDSDKQTMAVSCRNCVGGPLFFAVAPLIGYFRDVLGSYDFFLLGIGIALLLCCFSWLIVPCMARCKRNQ